jgi:hypothetical protein
MQLQQSMQIPANQSVLNIKSMVVQIRMGMTTGGYTRP